MEKSNTPGALLADGGVLVCCYDYLEVTKKDACSILLIFSLATTAAAIDF